jgi:exopolyphosphatase/guanosine-5'-triphosphate,3'-diphosphate pyrophosphatase
MSTRIAIIDLGTNTFHLLLAELTAQGYCITHRERLAVKLGMGGINRGIITEDGIHRALVALQSFSNQLAHEKVDKVYAFGTSALRSAVNGQEVIDKIRSVTGIDVHIISGDHEATFIYKGVRSAVDLSENSLIMDIGGGSVEFIIGNNDQVLWQRSFEIGAQRLLEKFQHHDPILAEEQDALFQYVHSELAELRQALAEYHPTILVGSSGTFDTLSDIFCFEHHIHKAPEEIETPLTLEGFEEIYHELVVKNRQERMLVPGMIEMRVDMIVVACCLIKYILGAHPFERIRVSTYSLKEGVLAWLSKEIPV